MSELSPAQLVRQRIAGRKRQDPDADVTDLQRELRAIHFQAWARELVRDAPELTEKQKHTLRAIFEPYLDADAP